MYSIPIYKVMLVKDGNQKAEQKSITCPNTARDIVSSYLAGVDREHFVALMVDQKHKVIGINTVSVGSLNSSVVHPREVFKPAILSNAAAIILAHNHPSGDPMPSAEDIEVTRRLVAAGETLGIAVLDHIIIGCEVTGRYVSLKEQGII